MEKDTQDKASESEINLKAFLADAYLHPIFRSFEEVELVEVRVEKSPPDTPSQLASEPVSRSRSPSPSPPHHLDQEEQEESVTVQHYEVGPPANVYHYGYEHHENIFHYNMDQYNETQHNVENYNMDHSYYRY